MSLFSSSARYVCSLESLHKFFSQIAILCILDFLRRSITIYLFFSTLSLTLNCFGLHVDLYKAKARVIGMRSFGTAWISSTQARGACIGIRSRVNHVTSVLRIGEQSESPADPDPELPARLKAVESAVVSLATQHQNAHGIRVPNFSGPPRCIHEND